VQRPGRPLAGVKAACYQDIEAVIGPDVPLWSATSNFPMTRLAAGMAHPKRAIVVHPVQTQLIIFVEVVAGERTSEDTIATTMRFCQGVGLRSIRVQKEIPGFLWNRVWFAMLREMLHLVDIGAADPLELDSIVQSTLRAFVPVFGPLQMTDLIGHDTSPGRTDLTGLCRRRCVGRAARSVGHPPKVGRAARTAGEGSAST
jgi:3-hydroxybutyryl-CoA dehydrogenase